MSGKKTYEMQRRPGPKHKQGISGSLGWILGHVMNLTRREEEQRGEEGPGPRRSC